MDLSNVKIRDKVKSQLYAISCATGELNEKVEYKHWWTVVEFVEDAIKVEDKKGEIMFFDRSGRGLLPNRNHFIYKVKTS
jgi:hypothetical protein